MANSTNKRSPGGCASSACVDLRDTGYGVELFSTLGSSHGTVEYTAEEFAQFLSDVKAGRYDAYLSQVPATV